MSKGNFPFVLKEEEMKEVVKRPTFFPQLVYDVIQEALEDDNDMIANYTTKAWQERIRKRSVKHTRDPQTGLCSLILTNEDSRVG